MGTLIGTARSIVQSRAHTRVRSGLPVLAALLVACAADAPTLKDGYGPNDAGADARGESPDAAQPDFGNVDLTDPDNVPRPDGQGGAGADECVRGSAIGAGVMSGALAGEEPVLSALATLDRFPEGVPGSLQGMLIPPPTRLERRSEGLIAITGQGFFDVGRTGEVRFYLVQSFTTPNVLSGDLDGDGDEDAVSIGFTVQERVLSNEQDDDAGEPDFGQFATFWARNVDGVLERRTRIVVDERVNTPIATLADLDGDGDLDIVSSGSDGTLHALRNDGGFAFTRTKVPVAAFVKVVMTTIGLFAEDRDRDGAVDLIALVGDGVRLHVRVFMNDGAGIFAAPVVTELTPSNVEQIGFGDVSGDGLSDFVMHTPVVRIAPSLEPERFADTFGLAAVADGFALADIDGDDVLDIATHSHLGVEVFFASDSLMGEPLHFDVPPMLSLVIESAPRGRFAQLSALYQATCRPPCGESCELSCIFKACVDCIAHSDCQAGEVCRHNICELRER